MKQATALSWRRPYELMGSAIHSPYADLILGALFYIEAIFFIPTDPILILYCLERQDRAISYAKIATIGSVLGGATSYMIGLWLWNSFGEQIIHNRILNLFLTPEKFHYLAANYQKYEWFAIFMAGVTPIPYKAATLSAGFCRIAFMPFIGCSILARGARFFLYAIICKFWGHRIKGSVQKYFNLILLFAVILVILTTWLFT